MPPTRSSGRRIDPTDDQPFYFVGPSFDQLLSDLDAWLAARAAQR